MGYEIWIKLVWDVWEDIDINGIISMQSPYDALRQYTYVSAPGE